MKQLQEIEVWYILPAIRRDLAKELMNLGLKQKEVANILDITEPAVSQYFKAKRAKDVKFDNNIKKKIKETAKKIYQNPSSLFKEIQDICNLIRKNKLICDVHKRYDKLEKNCSICFKSINTKYKKIQIKEKNHTECRLCGNFHKIDLKNCPNCGYLGV
ncbi:MAG: transcriptional regulator [Nanoarchaeota archaeon]|nr:transcriptional regulator [Nanoarchaeota archaeon]